MGRRRASGIKERYQAMKGMYNYLFINIKLLKYITNKTLLTKYEY
jgi:hypothetical protein